MYEAAMGKTQSAPPPTEKFDRLKAILREMFQLDRGDLDFGLYRIMNRKAKEIEEFLDNDLLPQVRTALKGNTTDMLAVLEEKLADARGQASDLGVDPETAPKVEELKRQLAEAKADRAAETDVYNHLANFFARYYDEGDFMSLRRYSGGGQPSYLIPYDGEEVKLHWANADQYYIKTTENYSSYVFTVATGAEIRRVRFEIVGADNEKDNVKEATGKQRRFLLASDKAEAVSFSDADLVVRFAHRPLTDHEKKEFPGNGAKQQDRINETIAKRVLQSVQPDWQALLTASAPTGNNPERTVLDKHLATYTAKNSFDYFIHKDLGGFLRRELDFYLKNDVLNLEDLALGDAARLDRALARMRAVRHVADKVIDFLAQLENFQKQLWLKKKFILETQYCVTLDRIPETLYAEIASNKAQRNEWVKLFAIDEIKGDLGNGGAGYSEPLNMDFLKANPFLVLDTRHFNADFTNRALAALSEVGPLDEQMDGLLIHGENFQALNLLQTRYRSSVQCCYIDPPFNAQSSEILYKNTYRDSTWISFIENRLAEARGLESTRAVVVVAIDEMEQEYLGCLLNAVFFDMAKTCVTVVHNATGQQGNNFSTTHEYAYFLYPVDGQSIGLQEREKNPDIRPLRNVSKGQHLRTDAANCFYPIFVLNGKITGFGDVCPDDFHPAGINVVRDDGTVEVYPIDTSGTERKWVFARQSVEDIRDELFPKQDPESGAWDIIRKKTRFNYKTVWAEERYSANSWGSRVLNEILGANSFTFPKSIHTVGDCVDAALNNESAGIVLDYFAGSGTTGHAVVNLNREDGGNRRFVLVEMGQYFDTVLLPRMKKVVYSCDWKAGKPVSREGVSQFFKYVRLESYEDTLDSLKVTPPDSAQQDLLEQNSELAEDYRLRYALGVETSGSACLLGKDFTDPFAYTLSVVRDGARQEVPVDLPETFNYLLGLRVKSRRLMDGVLAITGTDAEGKHCLILWRNLNETDNAALETWFTNHRAEFAESIDLIYTNGDHTLNVLKQPTETWTAKTIEPVFREMMFEEMN